VTHLGSLKEGGVPRRAPGSWWSWSVSGKCRGNDWGRCGHCFGRGRHAARHRQRPGRKPHGHCPRCPPWASTLRISMCGSRRCQNFRRANIGSVSAIPIANGETSTPRPVIDLNAGCAVLQSFADPWLVGCLPMLTPKALIARQQLAGEQENRCPPEVDRRWSWCNLPERRTSLPAANAGSLGKFFPFYITRNEVRCSEDVPQ